MIDPAGSPRENPGRTRRAARAVVRFLTWLATPRQLLLPTRREPSAPDHRKRPAARED
jgi:hypothetical protein